MQEFWDKLPKEGKKSYKLGITTLEKGEIVENVSQPLLMSQAQGVLA
jgi:hypothetical protein